MEFETEPIQICMVPDHIGSGDNCRWPDGDIPYAIANLLPGIGEADMRKMLAEVYDHIASECGITPREIETAAKARILLTTGHIDGPGGTLAWAYLPCGNLKQSLQKYDTGERQWVIWPNGPFPRGTIDAWRVILHETIHSLGVEHGQDIMKPAVDPNVSRIGAWTRNQLRRRYGGPKARPTPGPGPLPQPTPTPSGGEGGLSMSAVIELVKKMLPVARLVVGATPTKTDDAILAGFEALLSLVDQLQSGSITTEEFAAKTQHLTMG